jgi:hypothetical protein
MTWNKVYMDRILPCLTWFRILRYEIGLFRFIGYETLHKGILVTKEGPESNIGGLKSKILFFNNNNMICELL